MNERPDTRTEPTPESVLKTVFGYDEFRPLQREIIECVLAKRDVLAVMPTGGGKSLCYQVPALLFPGLTIVVSPLIALMQDQVAQLDAAGVSALFVNSTLDRDEWYANMARVRSGDVKLLYLAPESLVTPRVQELLAGTRVDCVTVDEAHCISDWGHDFRPEYRSLAEVRALFPHATCLALTATATAQVRRDIKKTLKLDDPAEFVASFNRPNIFLEVRPKRDALAQVLAFVADNPEGAGIVYCFSRKQVDELAASLVAAGHAALPYHAGLSDDERRTNQEKFLRDEARIVVATVAFGMGINKPDVSFVIHFDLPKSPEQYYQEIGRAGRDGRPARAILFYGYGDTRKIRFFMEDKSASETKKAEAHLKAMTDYAEARACRRKILLAWFGETYVPPEPCASGAEAVADAANAGAFPCCDVCANPRPAETDATVVAQKFLSCVARTGERFGAAYVIDVLLGSKQKRIVDNGHHKISTWGIGGELDKDGWFEIARLLTDSGLLSKDGEYGVLSLTRDARDALAAREAILLPIDPAFIGAGGSSRKGGSAERGGSLKFPKKGSREAARELDPEGERALAALKAMRRGLAEAASVPPYVIFSDRTLEELADRRPESRAALLGVFGIGAVKAERYGDYVMQAIRAADRPAE
jgi:ATP-dependent DNA helicase RecQ